MWVWGWVGGVLIVRVKTGKKQGRNKSNEKMVWGRNKQFWPKYIPLGGVGATTIN